MNYRKKIISYSCTLTLSYSIFAAEDFDTSFLENVYSGDVSFSELLEFAQQDKKSTLPGIYLVDIYLNDIWLDRKEVLFIATNIKENEEIIPCFTLNDIQKLNIKTEIFRELNFSSTSEASTNCIDFTKFIPDASVVFDVSNLKINISIPQAFIRKTNPMLVPPSMWDEGITALRTTYLFNNLFNYGNTRDHNTYLNLQNTLDIAGWHFNNFSLYSNNTNQTSRWQNVSNYAQRAISSWKSQIKIGDAFSSNTIFDGTPFRGIQLSSDLDMIPDNEKDYSPVIRGIANSNALITITQNNYTIYQSNVPPGEFVIDDLYLTGGSGDLIITIRENDGTEQTFIQPYTPMPVLKKEGFLDYEFTIGEYRPVENLKQPYFLQSEITLGLPYSTTIYGGVLGSKDYYAINTGLGKSLGYLGGASADMTYTQTRFTQHNRSGAMLRTLYSKTINSTGTTFNILNYRYASRNYLTFTESNILLSTINSSLISRKNRFEVVLSQSISGWGSFYINNSWENYWESTNQQQLLQIGYSNSIKKLKYSLLYSESRTTSNVPNKTLFLSFSIPLSIRNNESSPHWLSYSYTGNNNDLHTHLVSLSGRVLEDSDNLNYSIQQSYANSQAQYNGGVNLNYKSSYADYDIGYTYNDANKQLNANIRGSAVIHSGGITFSQPINETAILVDTHNVPGLSLVNNPGVKTDWLGYAIIPNATPYQINRVEINADSLNANTDLRQNTMQVVPTRGSIVKAQFHPNLGYRVILQVRRDTDDLIIPFGAVAYPVNDKGERGENMSIIGEDGQVYFSGLPAQGKIEISWGRTSDQTCAFEYQLPESVTKTKSTEIRISMIPVRCY